MERYFNPSQKSMAGGAFAHAENLAGHYFRLSRDILRSYRYDVRTLANLEKHEVHDGAFAHLCKYQLDKSGADEGQAGHFYRVCLQDNRILDAIERAGSFIKFIPLMLYIATHELVHIIRFDGDLIDFDAPMDVKQEEEERVHVITREMLRSVRSPEMNIVMDCFSTNYKIGDIFN